MRLIIDDKIPYIREAAERIADEVVYAPGRGFTPELVREADALVVRTRTRCDRRLLEGSRVRLVATATIGFDHIDTDYCREAGVAWANAPGCNAPSVAQYVRSALLAVRPRLKRELGGLTIGIVGAGHVGQRVAEVAGELGMRVLLNDPPREEREGSAGFASLRDVAETADVVSLHTPLVREGRHRTFHLADGEFFRSLRRKPLFINTSRGEVADTAALLAALREGTVADAIVDVWEREPDIDRELLHRAFIATPHIAGYSADGKANATRMALDAVCRFFGIEARYDIVPPEPAVKLIRARSRKEASLLIYNPLEDSARLKAHPERFEALRENYPLRREEKGYEIMIND